MNDLDKRLQNLIDCYSYLVPGALKESILFQLEEMKKLPDDIKEYHIQIWEKEVQDRDI